MANYDIRFVLRHAQDFIRQSGWTHNTTFTRNDKALITATWDIRCSCISTAGKLVKDLKILLAFPHFDIRYTITHDGNLLIAIDKSLTPPISTPRDAPVEPTQNYFKPSTLNHTRRKNNASDADQS